MGAWFVLMLKQRLYTPHFNLLVMKLLAEIADDVSTQADFVGQTQTYGVRKSARVILLNQAGEMAVQHLVNDGYHKLPGGGIDVGETAREALKREVREEVGCNCEIQDEIGVVIEYRAVQAMIHISYCFLARVVGEIGAPTLEPDEIKQGQTTVWLKPAEALQMMRLDNPTPDNGKMIVQREMVFLEEYLIS